MRSFGLFIKHQPPLHCQGYCQFSYLVILYTYLYINFNYPVILSNSLYVGFSHLMILYNSVHVIIFDTRQIVQFSSQDMRYSGSYRPNDRCNTKSMAANIGFCLCKQYQSY